MAFRFWAFRRWVFPDECGRDPDKALESALTDGGIAEAIEEGLESGKVTLFRRRQGRRLADERVSDPSRVSKTS